MLHPSPNKIRDFTTKLSAIISKFPEEYQQCDMIQGNVLGIKELDAVHHKTANIQHRQPLCGTPGCHAGWAYLALTNKFEHVGSHYSTGMFLLIDAIGFVEIIDLLTWADDNPHLWGNSLGKHMFINPRAFDQENLTFHPQVLVDHWNAVADRIEALT